MLEKVELRIADTRITLQSKFPLEQFSPKRWDFYYPRHFRNFLYRGRLRAHIVIEIKVIKKLLLPKDSATLFVTYHPQDGSENWRLIKNGSGYIYTSSIKEKEQVVFVNEKFNKATAYLLPKENKGFVWNPADVIYDFLQVLLINYFAQRRLGVFTHAVGIKDLDQNGLLFAGKSGTGKTTACRIWHRYSRAKVLNDDRVIITKLKENFLAYSSPWHGDFGDYLATTPDFAYLKKIFFIHHSQKNRIRALSAREALLKMYPVIIPAFWNAALLANIASFCEDLSRNIECFKLGFVDDRRIIPFVRKIL